MKENEDGSPSSRMVTTDVLIDEAMAAYIRAGAGMEGAGEGTSASGCIPVWAAEDFLVFDRGTSSNGQQGVRLKELAWTLPVVKAWGATAAMEKTTPRPAEPQRTTHSHVSSTSTVSNDKEEDPPRPMRAQIATVSVG